MAERSEEHQESGRQTRQQREEQAKEEAKQQEAQRVADAPNPMGPPGEGTVNPELLSAAEVTKAHYARLPEDMRQALDRFKGGGQQFVRGGARYEVGVPDGYILVTKVEDSPPKNVYMMPAPSGDEVMEG